MLNKLISIPLLPVIYLQGKQLKKSIPEIPEPEGVRVGKTGIGEKLSLLIIGDSAAAGVGVETQQDSLLGQLVSLLKIRYEVTWCLHAKSGATTIQTLRSLDKITHQKFDVVVTSIGLNDMTHQVSRKSWGINMDKLKQQLVERFSPQIIITSGLPPIGKFPTVPFPLNWYLGGKAQEFNQDLKKKAEQNPTIEFLSLALTDKSKRKVPTDFLACDGFHPGQKVYRLWAEQVYSLIQNKVK